MQSKKKLFIISTLFVSLSFLFSVVPLLAQANASQPEQANSQESDSEQSSSQGSNIGFIRTLYCSFFWKNDSSCLAQKAEVGSQEVALESVKDSSGLTVLTVSAFKGDRGEQGERGLDGASSGFGPQGVAGEKGATGSVGEKGDQGDKGDSGDGSSYTASTGITIISSTISSTLGTAIENAEIADNTITFAKLASNSCNDGQIPKYNSTSSLWECSDDDGSGGTYTASAGLTLVGSDFRLDATGCVANEILKRNTTNNAWECVIDVDTDTDTTYTASTGLTLSGTAFSLNINGLTAISAINDADTLAIYDDSVGGVRKVTRANFLSGITGALVYQGGWNTSTNSPTLADSTGTQGYYYIVDTAGSQDLGSGSISFTVGDWVIYNGSIWEKLDSTNDVQSVFGRNGIVVATTSDYDAIQIDNTATGNIVATNMQAAVNELDAEKQTVDAQLTDVAGLTPSNGIFIVGDGSNFVGESGATARTSLGLGGSNSPTFTTINLSSGTSTTISTTRSASGQFVAFTDGTDSFGLYNYAGTPETNIIANTGSLAIDTTNGQLYIKGDDGDNTGWTLFATSSGTDDQTIDVLTFSGDTLSLSLEGDGETTKTVDFSTYAKDADLHNAVTLSGSRDYMTLSGQDLVRGVVDISDDTNLTAGTGITLTGDTISTDLGVAVDSSEIINDSIVNADINSAASIVYSKLNLIGLVDEDDLKSTNSPTDNYLLSYDSSTTGFTWVAGSSTSLFTDGGTVTYLTSLTDDVAFGGTSSSAPFFFDESAEALTLINTTVGDSFRVNDEASDTTPFIINTSGSVGIGTAGPNAKLHIASVGAYNGTVNSRTGLHLQATNTTGGFANTRIQFSQDGGTTSKSYIEAGVYGSDYLAFGNGSGSGEAMRINSAGSLGIGTDSPGSKLQVAGSIRSNDRLIFNASDQSNLWNLDNSAGSLRIFREDFSASGNGANGAVAMTITNAGLVGIGATPSYDFDVSVGSNGYARVSSTGSDVVGRIIERSQSGGSYNKKWTTYMASNSTDLRFATAASNVLTLQEGGNLGVGIGITSPTIDLAIGDSDTGINHESEGVISFRSNGTERLKLVTNVGQTSIDVTAGNGTYNTAAWPVGWGGGLRTYDLSAVGIQYSSLSQTSDRRWKKDITTIDNALAKIAQMRGVYYKWKNAEQMGGDEGTQLGFIAQEVEEIIPEVVRELTDGYKTISYISLVPLNTQAIKELDLKINGIEDLNIQMGDSALSITELGEFVTDQQIAIEALGDLRENEEFVALVEQVEALKARVDETDVQVEELKAGNELLQQELCNKDSSYSWCEEESLPTQEDDDILEPSPTSEASQTPTPEVLPEPSPTPESTPEVSPELGTIKVLDNELDFARLRESNNTESDELAHIPVGTQLVYMEIIDGWYYTTYDGFEGWISGTLVEEI